MNRLLFERSSGGTTPDVFAELLTTRLLRSFRPAPRFRFDGSPATSGLRHVAEDEARSIWAHQSGVNALALERFDGRLLLSGGSDAAIKIWDLEQCGNPTGPYTHRPVAHIHRSVDQGGEHHRFGVTHLSFYPFDPDAFLSTSYDQTLKLWATQTARMTETFDLGRKVYTHAVSPIASHLLVACGTQHPAVRLVDLRSGASAQSLFSSSASAAGAVLAVAWSPRDEHMLVSGSLDGGVRIWDVRKANSLIGTLDQEDSLGIFRNGMLPPVSHRESVGSAHATAADAPEPRFRVSAKAHSGPVNGLSWTDNGAFIISAGHDRRIRVWDSTTRANTLASFGPSIQNGQAASVHMFVSPVGLTASQKEVLFWPNEHEILVLDLHDGSIVTRLRGMGPAMASHRSRAGERTVKNRVTSLVWRGAGGYGSSSGPVMGGTNAVGGIYSGHMDGQIRAWIPDLGGLDEEDEDDTAEQEAEERAKKRKAVDNAFKSLMGRQITFT